MSYQPPVVVIPTAERLSTTGMQCATAFMHPLTWDLLAEASALQAPASVWHTCWEMAVPLLQLGLARYR